MIADALRNLGDGLEGDDNEDAVLNVDSSSDDFEALREEMQSWRDNMEAGGMTAVPKFDEVSECCDALEAIEIPEQGTQEDFNAVADEIEAVEFPGMY